MTVTSTSSVPPRENVETTVASECQPVAVGPESRRCVRGSSCGFPTTFVSPPPIGTVPGSHAAVSVTKVPALGRSSTPDETVFGITARLGPVGPGGPALPGAPGGPTSPGAPTDPAGPGGPGGPATPGVPATPGSPGGPGGPGCLDLQTVRQNAPLVAIGERPPRPGGHAAARSATTTSPRTKTPPRHPIIYFHCPTSCTTVTAVTRPSALSVSVSPCRASPYVPAVTIVDKVGFGYVPANDPPAAPEGGKLAGAPVTFVHATSEISAFPTALAAIVGAG